MVCSVTKCTPFRPLVLIFNPNLKSIVNPGDLGRGKGFHCAHQSHLRAKLELNAWIMQKINVIWAGGKDYISRTPEPPAGKIGTNIKESRIM